MRSTFSLLPYINRSKVKADGTTAVLCRITIDGKQTVISPGIYCRPEDWNGRKNEIKSARENNRLREYLRMTEEAYNEILKSQGVVSAEMLKNHITLNNIHPTTLLQMGEWERERLKKHSEEIDSTSSYRSSMYYQKYLTNYLMSLGKKDIGLEEVTEDFGKAYKAFLKRCKNFGASQTNHCLRWLNRLLYLAVDKEIIRVNPCEEMEYETKPEARHRYISREGQKNLEDNPGHFDHRETDNSKNIEDGEKGQNPADKEKGGGGRTHVFIPLFLIHIGGNRKRGGAFFCLRPRLFSVCLRVVFHHFSVTAGHFLLCPFFFCLF